MTHTQPVAGEPDRLHVLDVLRGIALLGMFLVHFSDFASGGSAADKGYQSLVTLLFEERFWAMFAMLFGAGFAIQLRRADARGRSFVPLYLRRLAALAVIGFAAHAFFGFNVLLGYAAWGLPLIVVRRWSVRALVLTTVVSAASFFIYFDARAAYAIRTRGEQAFRAERQSTAAANAAFREANKKAQDATDYRSVVAARLQHMRGFYAQPFSFLPVNNLTLFLLGLIGLRLGLFDNPERHRRLIATIALYGAASWAVSTWVFPILPAIKQGPMLRMFMLNQLLYGFSLVREMWLAFTYIGIVLLLVAYNRNWVGRLAAFGWTGRMALTNYLIQIALIDLTFSKYALGLSVTPLVGIVMALALFVADALFSRWWLARFRYGPFEWLWRSVTYAQWQPWRVAAPTPAVREELVAIG